MLVRAEEGRSVTTAITQAMKNQPCLGRVKNDSYWQSAIHPSGRGAWKVEQNDNKIKKQQEENGWKGRRRRLHSLHNENDLDTNNKYGRKGRRHRLHSHCDYSSSYLSLCIGMGR